MPFVGQAVFTQSQLDEINDRIDNQSTDYWSSGNGYYGDGLAMYTGAETFLNQERGAGTYANEYDWATAPVLLNENNKEPRPGADVAGGSGANGSQDIEHIHDASVLCIVWAGRTDIVTFDGITKTKNEHSEDLAIAIYDVLQRRASDPVFDWTNRTNWPIDGSPDRNPFFIIQAKNVKYLNSFACIYDQLPNGTDTSTIEQWFLDGVEYARLQLEEKNRVLYGSSNSTLPFSGVVTLPNAFPNLLYETASGISNPDTTNQLHTYYDSQGNGFNTITWLQASGLNNRLWDGISFIGAYGIMFDSQVHREFEENFFVYMMQVGVFPDGTFNEWYRSYDNDPNQGLNYLTVTIFHLVSLAYRHAVAVNNGLLGVGNDAGKWFNYTTSEGTDEIFNNYVGDSTSGGTKGLLNVLLNMSNYYRSSANGGWNDLRFAEGGTPIDEENKPFTVLVAMANSFYDNQTLRDFYRGNNGFTAPNYYSNGFTIDSSSSWGEHSYQPWGVPSSYGRYLGLADMEGQIFSTTNNLLEYNTNPLFINC